MSMQQSQSSPCHVNHHAPAVEASPDRSQAEFEFSMAVQNYKRQSGRLFPTWSEVLEVATSLGYTKAS